MNTEQRKLLKELVELPHFHVLKQVIEERLAGMRDVTGIEMDNPNFATIAMGKKIAVEEISEMLTDIGLYESADREKDNSYE
jgi:hypothetical protein